MHAGTRRVCPNAVAVVPRGDNPAISLIVPTCRKGLAQRLIVICLLVEAFCAFEQDAVLDAEISQGFLRSVFQPELHIHYALTRPHFCSELDAVWQLALDVQRAVLSAVPLKRRQSDSLFS